MEELIVRRAATSVTANVNVPKPNPIVRSAFSSATPALLWLVNVSDPVDAAAQNDEDGNSPQQNDWHGCSPLD